MSWMRNATIKRKLTVISLLTCGAALGLTCAVLVVHEVLTSQREMVNTLSVQAKMISGLSTAALSFGDKDTAREILGEFQHEPAILAAVIYYDGGVFAEFVRPGANWSLPPQAPDAEGHRFSLSALELSRVIRLKEVPVGAVLLRMDIRPLYRRLLDYVLIVIVVLVASVGVALLLSGRLQRSIAGPVASLSATAAAVVKQQDYSVRARQQGEDELGALTAAFNQMLSHIQTQDDALRKRFLMERLVGELSTHFINVPAHEIDQAIAHALDRFGQFAAVDRCHVVLLSDDHATVTCANEWTGPGVPPLRERIHHGSVSDFPWWFDHLERGEPIVVNRVEQLPPAAGAEQRRMVELGIQSRMAVPMTLKDRTIGWVGFDMAGRARDWSDSDLTMLRLVAQIIINALERKRAAEEMDALNHRLISTSRLAGMAEVATGVLHNVGNVLNSVNVSCNLVVDRLRQSRITGLKKIVGLLEEHAHDAAAFLANDPRGQRIPAYLRTLAPALAEDQAFLVEEVDALRKRVDHIKEIVAMQQSYGRVSGLNETIAVSALVEDAITLNAGALARHGIHVHRDYQEVSPILTDKHKVLQILLNLIRNAKYACDESGNDTKTVTLRIFTPEPDRVRIQVVDNGVGIPPENLTRIFQHGFTTRRDGHGFGLHSGALAARELGGNLWAESAGVGHGALFTLELPLVCHSASDDLSGRTVAA